MPATITPEELATWQAAVEEGRSPSLACAARLLAELERLQGELAHARANALAQAAVALASRLSDLASYGGRGGACPACRDGEAHAFLAKLLRAARKKS